MNGVVELNLFQFSLIYILLLVVLLIMKLCHVSKTKLLILASIRMTVQLVLAGLILTYIFQNPHPAFTVLYLLCMTAFACGMTLHKNRGLNRRFKLIAVASLSLTGLFVVVFFVCVVVGMDFFLPQYTIPLSGMIIGNAMTGMTLGLKSFREKVASDRVKIETLLFIGAHPKDILLPIVRESFETALLPTMNSMLGMGIISLPGMMTGQILSGTAPTTAILYQIAIMIAITAVTCFSVFCCLYLGFRTLYNKREQMEFLK